MKSLSPEARAAMLALVRTSRKLVEQTRPTTDLEHDLIQLCYTQFALLEKVLGT